MRSEPIVAALMCLGVMCGGCVSVVQETPAVEETVSTEADAAAIRTLMHEGWERSLNEGDLEGWMSTMADDVAFMPPNEQVVEGIDAVRTSWQPVFEQFEMAEVLSVTEIAVGGDWAFVQGAYEIGMTPREGGETAVEVGKYLLILARQPDASWKVY